MASVLSVRGLSVSYGDCKAINSLNFDIEAGHLVMLIGESGSGKSTLIRSVLGLLGNDGDIVQGEILFDGTRLPIKNEKEMRVIRGKHISIILQNPDRFLDPLLSIETQYHEALSVHSPTHRKESRLRAMELFQQLGFSSPQDVLRKRPFELSGGMCQRAAIAIAMANTPRLLLADEPTSALDVASQKDVMELLKSIQKKRGTTILLVTHNMSIVSRYADEVGIMYHGHLVEWGDCKEVLNDPRHAYTQMLLDAVPHLDGRLPDVRHPMREVLSIGSEMHYISERHCYLG